MWTTSHVRHTKRSRCLLSQADQFQHLRADHLDPDADLDRAYLRQTQPDSTPTWFRLIQPVIPR